MLTLVLALVGVGAALVAVTFGFLRGEMDRIEADPEVKAHREAEEKERRRQSEWRKKAGKEDGNG